MDLEEWMEYAVRAVEIVGIAVLLIGSILSLVGAARTFFVGEPIAAYERARHGLGRSIVLGLDILVIAIFIETVTIDHTLENAVILAAIVFIRIILSFSLVIESDGVVPWSKRRAGALSGGLRTKSG